MAITGTWNKHVYTQSETEVEEFLKTYATNIPEGDPDYDKRGTTETITRPAIIASIKEIPNVYDSWF